MWAHYGRTCWRNASSSSVGERTSGWHSFRRSHPRKQRTNSNDLGRKVWLTFTSENLLKCPCRIAAVDACRWVTQSVAYAPYVTSLPWISHYGCQYVVHGDDITSDSSGEDCYRYVKQAGRFKVVKRTPSISTTDLVGRMLLCTRTHFIKSLSGVLDGREASYDSAEPKDLLERIRLYATDPSGLQPGASVWFWNASLEAREDHTQEERGAWKNLFQGIQPKPGQRVVYVDGGFDLFSSGHIEFLRLVLKAEEDLGREQGWYSKEAVEERTGKGEDYGPAFVVAGVHDDEVINHWKGVNYPIMNIYERGLCVLQCKVSGLWRASEYFIMLTCAVRQCSHLWRAFHPYKSILDFHTLGNS